MHKNCNIINEFLKRHSSLRIIYFKEMFGKEKKI